MALAGLPDDIRSAISIGQPFAGLVVTGAKPIETRPNPPARFLPATPAGVRPYPGRGISPGERIAIHAMATPFPKAHPIWSDERATAPGTEVLGAIIGYATVSDVIPIVGPRAVPGPDDLRCIEYTGDGSPGSGYLAMWPGIAGSPFLIPHMVPLGIWTPGRWAWVLTAPERLDTPIYGAGAQGVWGLDRFKKKSAA